MYTINICITYCRYSCTCAQHSTIVMIKVRIITVDTHGGLTLVHLAASQASLSSAIRAFLSLYSVYD